MLGEIASHVYRRAVDGGGNNNFQPPWWTALLVFIDLLLFLPIWMIVGYTLQNVIPTLAMVEDEGPPAYEPVALDPALVDHDDDFDGEAGPLPAKVFDDGPARAVTSSLRSSLRLLRSRGGFRAYLRGLPAFAFYSITLAWTTGLVSLFLPRGLAPLATLPASLMLVQFRAGWVHAVLTPRSELPFWRRLPAFRRTLRATAGPTALVWLAGTVGSLMPICAMSLLDVSVEYDNVRSDMSLAWKGPVVIVAILVQVLLIIPAEVVLTRVIASLLPEDQDTIVSFDRSFGGVVEPAVVTGMGYPTISQAWSTFTLRAWRRLVVLYAKLFAIGTAVGLAMAAIVIPEIFLVIRHGKQV